MEAVILAEDAVVHGLHLRVPAGHVHSLHRAGVGQQRLMGPRRSDPGADQGPARHTAGKEGNVKIRQQRRAKSAQGRAKSATA